MLEAPVSLNKILKLLQSNLGHSVLLPYFPEIYEVQSAFPEVEYDDDFEDPESSLFLETEKELIECLEEVLDELPGEICIDVTSIRLAVD